MFKKGFTLIELLAVIVVLALILAIAVPAISNLIANSKKSMFENSSKLILKSMKNDYDGKIAATGSFTDTFILYDNGVRTVYPSSNNLDFTINATDGGIVRYSDGSVNFALYDGVNCATKSRTSNDITIIVTDKTTCLNNIIYKQATAPFTNLAINGDFSNGTTGWSAVNAIGNVVNGSLNFTATAQYGKYYQANSYIANHLYYRQITMTASNTYALVTTDGYSTLYSNGTGAAQNISSIFTSSSTWTLNTRFEDHKLNEWSPVIIDNFIIIDLTVAFGTGNEPSKTQMENNIDKVWIDTANSNTPKRFTGGGWVNI